MNAIVTSNVRWGQKYGTLTLSAPDFINPAGSAGYRAGQLCMLSVQASGALDPLLKRPFAPYSVNNEGIVQIIYAIVGRGTDILSHQPAGAGLDISIPHGNPFPLLQNKKAALVAGGVGIAPMHCLAQKLAERGCEVDIYYGGRSADDIYKPALESPFNWSISTEDGSFGKQGLVTSLCEPRIMEYDHCYTCGPMPMMRAVFEICKNKGKSLSVSLEKTMACGIGVCSGCMVDIKQGDEIITKRCCTEGPVFDAYSVAWQ